MSRLCICFQVMLGVLISRAVAANSQKALGKISNSLVARDGNGDIVDWFFVLKLPQTTFSDDLITLLADSGFDTETSLESYLSTKHCDCEDPICPNSDYGNGRGSGLCYLYADSNNGSLTWFQDLGYDCLGQGGNDPVSQTLGQLYSKDVVDSSSIEWAFWNDQFQMTADSYYDNVCAYSSYSNESFPYTQCTSDNDCGKRCTKSASAYIECQTDSDCADGDSCESVQCEARALPHYNAGCSSPYAHAKGALAFEKEDQGFFLQASTPNFPDPSLGPSTFAPLGCQLADPTQFSQNFFGLTLEADDFQDAASALAAARLCSTQTASCSNGTAGHIWSVNCTSESTRGESWSILDQVFSGTSTSATDSSLHKISDTIKLMAKSEKNEIPPWYAVSTYLLDSTDLAVASWLDSGYGHSSICRGDDYSYANYSMCLIDDDLGLRLQANGSAQASIENTLVASFNGWAWGLFGDLETNYTSHAKWAVSTSTEEHKKDIFVSGDMNQQGFSCSTDCSGSQMGRGGLFFAVENAALADTSRDLIALACGCDQGSIETKRFCANTGCYYKDPNTYDSAITAIAIPEQTSSYFSTAPLNSSWSSSEDCEFNSKPVYDHQATAYTANFSANTTTQDSLQGTLTPFFSPDTSTSVLTQLIDEAQHSIDIYTPSASAWSSACDIFADSGCINGCSPSEMRADPFPVFGALLNALHRGISVRIITNDYDTPDCDDGDGITMLPFLVLNNASISYFTTVSYVHAKWISIDKGTATAVSSVNWSKTSFIKNREAGAILNGSTIAQAFMASVFEYDFALASPLVVKSTKYSAAELANITSKTYIDVEIPDSPHINSSDCYLTNSSVSFDLSDASSLTVAASPDDAYSTLKSFIDAATDTLDVYMYQVTGEVCDLLVETAQRGITVNILISSRIYDDCDCHSARACYPKLVAAGISVRKTSATCISYAHQKYWIVDSKSVGWSTGNFGDSDFPNTTSKVFPVFGTSDDWIKVNRDFSIYVQDHPALADYFKNVMEQDWDNAPATDWTLWSDIRCVY